MKANNRINGFYDNKKKLKDKKGIKRKLAGQAHLHDGTRFHPIPWIFYQFLSIEESVVLAALINIGKMAAEGEGSKLGVHILEIDGEPWFWCSVRRLCLRLNINGKQEHRIIKSLVSKELLSKKTLRTTNRRYIQIHFGVLEGLIQKALDEQYMDQGE